MSGSRFSHQMFDRTKTNGPRRMSIINCEIWLAKFLKTRRLRCFMYSILFFTLIAACIIGYQIYVRTMLYFNPPGLKFNANYFAEVEGHLGLGYIVDTPTCNIVNISSHDPAILPIIALEPNESPACSDGKRSRWTHTVGSTIIINTTAIGEAGYSFDYLDCCYLNITRVEQSLDNYNSFADFRVKFSNHCKPIRTIVTSITDSFIRVVCRGRWPAPPDVLYREFHALPQKESLVQERSNYWKSYNNNLPIKKRKRAPNIILVGIDSLSRLSFHRNMPKTKRVLEDYGFIEFFGYTKCGENTFPNACAFLTGYTEKELARMCYFTTYTAQDSCPYIWKRFQSANYLTGLVEDAPGIGIFYYEKTGFVHEPVDYYLRPFLLGIHQHTPSPILGQKCLGTKTADEVLLKYINDLNIISSERDVPLFLLSWMTSIAHGNLNGAQDGDGTYANFLKRFNYSNSIVIFMSDHGYRFGSIRQTFAGWYEDKLPMFWVHLPESVRIDHPDWYENLQENAKRVTSPFDLFSTMSHVLDEYTPTTQMAKGIALENGIKEEIPRVYGQSFFTPISVNRTCDDAGINNNFCACFIPHKVPVNDTNLQLAAKAAVDHINSFLTPKCKRQTLTKVTAGALTQHKKLKTMDSGTYVVGFESDPGSFLFEANVKYSYNHETNEKKFEATTDILRMNKISTDVSCVHDATLQRFCYCDFLRP